MLGLVLGLIFAGIWLVLNVHWIFGITHLLFVCLFKEIPLSVIYESSLVFHLFAHMAMHLMADTLSFGAFVMIASQLKQILIYIKCDTTHNLHSLGRFYFKFDVTYSVIEPFWGFSVFPGVFMREPFAIKLELSEW